MTLTTIRECLEATDLHRRALLELLESEQHTSTTVDMLTDVIDGLAITASKLETYIHYGREE